MMEMGLFKSYSEKEVKRIKPIVAKINSLEPEISKLSDKELRGKTTEFKERLNNGETLDDILPEAFAVVREASKRVLGMRHFDVQLIGGVVLHQGRIAEMKTGEGKTLVATLPVYLNALTGKGVHVITVNEYLAKRDSEWMGKVYKFLGLTVGLVQSQMPKKEKQEAYNADVTYGTNNEFGFDYLRDNMVINKLDMVQRGLNYAIVDEIDSILIDEARTPLIISGRAAKSSDLYKKADSFVRKLSCKVIVEDDIKNVEQQEDNENYDYIVDLKAKSSTLTAKGISKAEKEFGLENYNDVENSDLVHNVTQALRAHGVMKKDIDYIVKDGEVLIVDEFTGRIMYGRRYNDGLHQAIEAKEGVKIADESKTLATITFQNYFRMYDKLSGMTGTAMTEEAEFQEIYNLDVVAVPTNRPLIRIDNADTIYRTEDAKFRAVANEVKESYEKGQPVLVGTVSIEKSEKLSKYLNKIGVPHQILNAKNHEREAEIIAQAGKYKSVTIATNMAGRGTDIMLGGNSEYLAKQEMRKNGYDEEMIEQATAFNETDDEEILAARKTFKELQEKHDKEIKSEKEKVISVGGLKIIGTERHESRRIDNQLRGRSGRQGDPGESRFYLGMDDDLLKLFGGDAMSAMTTKLNVDEDTPIHSKILTRLIESSQKKVEGRNFSARKHVLSYDDVMNVQREIIYTQRREVLDEADMHEYVVSMMHDTCAMVVDTYVPELEEGNTESFMNEVKATFGITSLDSINGKIKADKVLEELTEKVDKAYIAKCQEIGDDIKNLERYVILKVVDTKWMDHIDAMDSLKNGIGLRAYGQKDPVVQYRIEGGNMFDEMIASIKVDVSKLLLHIVKKEGPLSHQSNVRVTGEGFENNSIAVGEQNPKANNVQTEKPKPIVNSGPKLGRNDPCWCGSGKKYKNCHGREEN
ncbi:MAG: preprotein translocase subunit SecA [Clostridia bacterium]|nr:preprotein translocase subunit SecA [Clostridia bacterium]